MALLEVAQIAGMQTMQASDTDAAIGQRLLQGSEDVAGEFGARVEEQNIAATALLEAHVARLCHAHWPRRPQEAQARLLAPERFGPQVAAVLRGVIDQDDLKRGTASVAHNAFHTAACIIKTVMGQDIDGKGSVIGLVEQRWQLASCAIELAVYLDARQDNQVSAMRVILDDKAGILDLPFERVGAIIVAAPAQDVALARERQDLRGDAMTI